MCGVGINEREKKLKLKMKTNMDGLEWTLAR